MFLIRDQADTRDESEGDERGGRRQIGLRFLQSYMLTVTSSLCNIDYTWNKKKGIRELKASHPYMRRCTLQAL